MNKVYIVESDYKKIGFGLTPIAFFTSRELAELFVSKREQLQPNCYRHNITEESLLDNDEFANHLNSYGEIDYEGLRNG